MYKVSQSSHPVIKVISILRSEDNACIPTDLANTDYQNFKKQINADEAQLEDADGVIMDKAYVASLP